jgi:hypothetical protein
MDKWAKVKNKRKEGSKKKKYNKDILRIYLEQRIINKNISKMSSINRKKIVWRREMWETLTTIRR